MAVKINRNIGRPSIYEYGLLNWAQDIVGWFTDWIVENNKIATGDALNGFEITITKPNEVQISAVDYIAYVFRGRGPGGFPPIDNIKDWIEAKPIVFDPSEISLNSLAFLISRKIAREGTNPPKLQKQNLDMVINMKSVKWLDRLGQDVAEVIAGETVKLFEK